MTAPPHAAEKGGGEGGKIRISRRALSEHRVEHDEKFAQPTDVSCDSAIDTLDRSSVPITFGSQHFDHLSAPSDQCHQIAAFA